MLHIKQKARPEKESGKRDISKKESKWCTCKDPCFHPFAPYCLNCGKLIYLDDDFFENGCSF